MMQVDPTQWKKKNVDELTLQERETMQDWVGKCCLRRCIRLEHSVVISILGLRMPNSNSWIPDHRSNELVHAAIGYHLQFRRFQMKYDIIGALTDGANPTTIDQLREKGIAQ